MFTANNDLWKSLVITVSHIDMQMVPDVFAVILNKAVITPNLKDSTHEKFQLMPNFMSKLFKV